MSNTAHGTPAGYVKHYAASEKPCTACREAHLAANRDHRQGKAKSARVPAILLAELYLNASPEVQVRAEQILGSQRLESFVNRYDAGEAIAA